MNRHKLNEAITEYINQQIINIVIIMIDILKHLFIFSIIGEDTILKAYFSNNLNLIVDSLASKTNKPKEEVFNFINSIDYLYYEKKYKIKM